MEILFTLVRKLVALVIVAGFCELLLPEGIFRSYARLVVGLMVLALILQPLAEARNGQIDWNRLAEVPGLWSGDSTIPASQWQLEQTKKLVEEQLAEEVTSLLPERCQGADVKVVLDIEYDQQGSLSSFSSMVIYLSLQGSNSIRPVEPVNIGDKPVERYRQWAREEVSELAAKLGVPGEKIIVYEENSGGDAGGR